ncbi:MAG: Asp-tRNA(Asn)/Glu-tRNA(Gln) amidotransferase subunit GatA [Veillonella sp.]|uniref:Asp-tRNA(Asn)/Glu-tRNA(Gln) amidotransferase subunit GatA n=1 Tax=Veillonella sp. TaxID=1926307 RepID=UPI001B655DBE|nr:Asp-tRNA(Asn)/Glu-tRNA(Gln) amidotransferase subunit GatA [Veillonella sp.]MBP6922606.1 Asp-tRNA(Asn)/Glu-tRNA(Gln) amidotransferase subunit GatA [Veillonella sp.]MBP8616283.1 Asp-tRNA(Asn)/Glu-tRNA(Gln) amidotransferase subunit GatA [Veillonella sp.]MBP9516603.1 Asp-tRNA(Asn)/Glu-tRNA(Gln) amidotransferase subunit GatA [Veillonella sp.]MBP9550452.1 Asp-tRNA(Asn)/Glu-tRNA(Gln) amidotransferase subunit GatA [Veillonella sp.]
MATIHELHTKLVNKEISAVELTKAVIAHKEQVEPAVHAYLSDSHEQALAVAANVDEKIAKGEAISPLAGVPGAIKDNICIQGQPATCASKMLENFIPPYNASVMEQLFSQDVVSLGKLNMDEFAMGGSTENSALAKTANPWNTDCVPGGSSGGSAAAVSSGSAIWALGSDTGGSIRQPASFCGVVGMKPTYGNVSRYGLIAFASSLDQIGPVTRDVTDAAIVMNAITGHDVKDSTSIPGDRPDYTKALVNDVKNIKIGVPKEYYGEGLNAEVRKAMDEAIETYKKLGAEIIEVSLPTTKYALSAYYIIALAEASTNLARYDGVSYGLRVPADNLVEMSTKTRTEGFGQEVQRRILLGTYVLSSGYYDAYYLKALKVRRLIKNEFDEAFKQVDLLLAPTAPNTSYKFGEKLNDPLAMYLEDVCTVPANLAGIPGISVPTGMSSSNLPIGMQLLGPAMGEEVLLRAAYTFEQARPDCQVVAPTGEVSL